MAKTIAEMTAEIREVNIEHGWRPAGGGPGENTWGDYCALLHSEISEALEAYRDYRLNDIIDHKTGKPEGVGSELADVLIRLLDMCDVFGISVSGYELLADVLRLRDIAESMTSFGDHMACLHDKVSAAWNSPPSTPAVLRALVTVADIYGIDLEAEYERKIAYNRTRSFQHGGRTVADPVTPERRLARLRNAIPDDGKDWWVSEEVGDFISRWNRLDLPRLTLQDCNGETLMLWCVDVRKAADLLGLGGHVGDDEGFTLTKGEYEVCIVQANEQETKHA